MSGAEGGRDAVRGRFGGEAPLQPVANSAGFRFQEGKSGFSVVIPDRFDKYVSAVFALQVKAKAAGR